MVISSGACFLALVISLALSVGCSFDDGCDKRISEMRQQYATVMTEITLTQKQLDEVSHRIENSPKGGTVKHEPDGSNSIYQGPNPEWLRRRDVLEDRIVELKSRQSGLESELNNLHSKP
jgi:predicted  nucleic acid-binding Zn-ribbon protein